MPDPKLIAWLGEVSADPCAFVMGAFPWGEPGRLETKTGPEAWQKDILNLIRDGLPLNKAIQLAVASGHGIGKSTLVAWIILWGLTTLPDTRGVVTANTETQLKTKTWAELGKWYDLFIAKDIFKLTATALFFPERERTWRIDMVPWSEKNPEAFAGMHNQGRRILMVFDEGSKIDDMIYETTEGALTDKDTQIIWAVFGNPTRNSGRFKELFTGPRSYYWKTRNIDSRDVALTDKEDIRRKIEINGEDSDYTRVRVKGQFPRTGEMEFISSADVEIAGLRPALAQRTDPLILGVDVARFGANESVLCFRKGRDARTIPVRRFRGLNTVELAAKIAEAAQEFRLDAIFIDGGGVGGGVVDNVRALQLHCWDIQFGGKSDVSGSVTGNSGERYNRKRSEMWGALRGWLKTGSIENDPDLKAQLIGPTYTFDLQDQISLEKKSDMMKRGVESPDWADALALTFAYPVAAHAHAGGPWPTKPSLESEYDPFSPERMVA